VSVQSAGMQETGGTYKLVRSAVVGKRPMAASYRGRHRLLCPHRLGWNLKKQSRALCYQYGGDSERGLAPAGSPANWRCMAVDELSEVNLLEDVWRTAPNHSRPQTCITEADVDAEGQPDRDPQKGQ
jgi:hypothetical protein